MSDLPTPTQRPNDPLCDRCGYSLEGTPDAPVCPECGLDFAASRAARVGSPWQRRPSLWTWAQTVLSMVFKPRQTMAVVRLDPVDSGFPGFRLFLCNTLLVPSAAFGLLAVAELLRPALGISSEDGIDGAAGVILVTLLAVTALFVWFVVSLMVFLLGRQLVRSASRPSPEILRGSHSLALHAHCVLAPTSAALIIDLLAGGADRSTPSLFVAGGLIWFATICFQGSRWPDRTPPASDR